MTILAIAISVLGWIILAYTHSKIGDVIGIILLLVGVVYIVVNEVIKHRGGL